jgi:hypothetical protein
MVSSTVTESAGVLVNENIIFAGVAVVVIALLLVFIYVLYKRKDKK